MTNYIFQPFEPGQLPGPEAEKIAGQLLDTLGPLAKKSEFDIFGEGGKRNVVLAGLHEVPSPPGLRLNVVRQHGLMLVRLALPPVEHIGESGVTYRATLTRHLGVSFEGDQQLDVVHLDPVDEYDDDAPECTIDESEYAYPGDSVAQVHGRILSAGRIDQSSVVADLSRHGLSATPGLPWDDLAQGLGVEPGDRQYVRVAHTLDVMRLSVGNGAGRSLYYGRLVEQGNSSDLGGFKAVSRLAITQALMLPGKAMSFTRYSPQEHTWLLGLVARGLTDQSADLERDNF